jgi:uncharacterized membrane protein YjgN (DUF898 family)
MQHHTLIYDGKTSRVYGLWFKKIIFSLFTLGIYSFWGRTNLRKYLLGSFQLEKDRFEYIGTGKELFISFLKALPLILIFYGALLFLLIFYNDEGPFIELGAFIVIYYFIIFARYSALRYRLSRLMWRGIRFYMDGPISYLAFFSMKRSLLNFLSLGLLIPRSDIKIAAKVYEKIHFGSIQMSFTPPVAHELAKINIVTLLLAPFSFGFSRLWYRARLNRFLCQHIKIDQLTISTTITGGSLFKLYLGDLLIIFFTLGLGTPLVIQRNLKYFADHYTLEGNIDTLITQQVERDYNAAGEGLENIIGDGSILG